MESYSILLVDDEKMVLETMSRDFVVKNRSGHFGRYYAKGI